MDEIKLAIQSASKQLYALDLEPQLSRPDEKHGDWSTNVALQIASKQKLTPKEVAEKLAKKLKDTLKARVTGVSVAGAGFINFSLSDEALWTQLSRTPKQHLKGKVVVAEYSDPNPFKVLHAGHVYTTVVGDAIAKLLEAAGAQVYRVNFGGDVGRHVAITMWAILKELGGENPGGLDNVPKNERAQWLANNYVVGTQAYETDDQAKKAITTLNKQIYELHSKNDHDSNLARIYWTCRQWSYDAFDIFYERLGTKLDKYYPESETAELGLSEVKKHIGDVFEESDGAVIFRGEPYGLHTRVFINAQGLPTYEAKDVGLIIKKYEDYKFDKSVVITGNEQAEYMAVVLKAIEQFKPSLAKASLYIGHGMLKLSGGIKMSSRRGNIVPAHEVIDMTASANKKLNDTSDDRVTLGAIKYAFLKTRIGHDIIYNPSESVALEGNSGPYIQYAHARARSILAKTAPKNEKFPTALEDGERSLVRKMSEFSDVVEGAIQELLPHHICTYLYELSQKFNQFYEKNRVIGDTRETIRLKLVENYADILRLGLDLLNVEAPDKV